MSAKVEPQTLISTAQANLTQQAVKPGTTTAPSADQQQTLELQLDNQLKAIGMQASLRNLVASTTTQGPSNEPLHDLPSDAVPSLLAQLPSAISVANADSIGSTNADSYSAACMEALRVSQQPGGTQAVAQYTQSFKNSALAAGVNAFVSANKSAAQSAQVDPYGNFGAGLLQSARSDYANIAAGKTAGSTQPSATPTPVVAPSTPVPPAVKPTPEAVAKPVAAPVAKPVAKPVPKPIAAPVAKPVAKPAAKAAAPMTDAEAMKLIPIISGAFPTGGLYTSSKTDHRKGPAGHDYNYDVSSVLHKQAPGHDQNNNPSVTQYASFIFTLSQAETKGSKAYSPALATWMTSNLSKIFPTLKGNLSMADAMKKQISIAAKGAGVNQGAVPNAVQQLLMYEGMQTGVQQAFVDAGYGQQSQNVPDITMV